MAISVTAVYVQVHTNIPVRVPDIVAEVVRHVTVNTRLVLVKADILGVGVLARKIVLTHVVVVRYHQVVQVQRQQVL